MKTWLRRTLRWFGILLVVLFILILGLAIYVQLTWNRPVSREVREMTAPTDAATVARGEFLFKYSLNCWDCHGSEGGRSPDEPQAGGRAFDLTGIGPPGGFGIVYASNITPDPETGIGNWTDGEIVRALREGLDNEGDLLFPIMESELWRGMSDEDVLALVAYLRSLDPVPNEVPANRFTFTAKALRALGVLKPQSPITAPVLAPSRGPSPEYGEYLAWRASGCGGCHSPRSPQTGQYDFSQPFAGGLFPFPEEHFNTTGPNLTPDAATGLGDWTEEHFMTALRNGVRPDGTVILPFMPWPSYARWSTEDLQAIWLYLRSLEPVEHQVPVTALKGVAAVGSGVDRGEALFEVYCLTCHGEHGTGAPFTTVRLQDAAAGMDDASLARIIREGFPGTSMPGFDRTLTRVQIEDIVAFIRAW